MSEQAVQDADALAAPLNAVSSQRKARNIAASTMPWAMPHGEAGVQDAQAKVTMSMTVTLWTRESRRHQRAGTHHKHAVSSPQSWTGCSLASWSLVAAAIASGRCATDPQLRQLVVHCAEV